MFIEPGISKMTRRSEERNSSLQDTIQVHFAPPNGAVGVRLALGYKHFTPPGWKAVPRDLALFR